MNNDTTKALMLAGRMADAARAVVGGQGLNFKQEPANVLSISALAERLQRAVDEYDRHIIDWSLKEDRKKPLP